MMLIIAWILICLAPAAWEYKPVAMSASWAESPGFVLATTTGSSKSLKPSAGESNSFFDETTIKYQFHAGDQIYTESETSLPHVEYFSHFPTDVKTDFKPSTKIIVRYKLDDPKDSVSPDIAMQYFTTALAQGVLVCITGAVILLIWSVTKSAV